MNAVPKSLNGIRSWTDAQRAKQAANLHARKIWLKSTGPRTLDGKIKSSRNARHADYDVRVAERAEMRSMKAYLRTQKSYTDLLKFFCKQGDSMSPSRYYATDYQLFILENELIAIEREMFDGLTFYELLARNIIPFLRPAPPR